MGEITDISMKRKKKTPVKDFLGKSTSELTIGDTLLMQTGSALIMVLVPMSIAGLGNILSKRGSQESQRL